LGEDISLAWFAIYVTSQHFVLAYLCSDNSGLQTTEAGFDYDLVFGYLDRVASSKPDNFRKWDSGWSGSVGRD
jgi:hypothetical protein